MRERPDIGGKRVPKTRRSVSERAIEEFELGCEWRKRDLNRRLKKRDLILAQHSAASLRAKFSR